MPSPLTVAVVGGHGKIARLLHPLLLEAGHTREFWSWVENYPKAEKAMGYLQGYSSAAHLEPPPGTEDESAADDVD